MSALIAYFSRADENYSNGKMRNLEVGNTEVAAKLLAELVGGDLFKIDPLVPYAKGYTACINEAKDHQRQNARPELTQWLDSIDGYDTIFLGYPNYWGSMPMAVFTFLDHYDFSGKTILPFCTHEGSGMGVSEKDIRKLCPHATLAKGLAIHGSSVEKSEGAIKKWLTAANQLN